jgi:hypothetical protein
MTKTTTILGISPGTRMTGLAVLQSGDLLDWRVKTFKGTWTNSKLKDVLYILIKYIQNAGITEIVLKKPDVFRTSEGLENLISEIKAFAKRKNIQFTMLSLKSLKSRYSKEKGYTKAKMIKDAISNFPELYGEYNKEHKNRNKYYTKMFEAVILSKSQE